MTAHRVLVTGASGYLGRQHRPGQQGEPAQTRLLEAFAQRGVGQVVQQRVPGPPGGRPPG